MAGAIVIGREDESVNPVRKKATLFSGVAGDRQPL
jgi:hypothetical protein